MEKMNFKAKESFTEEDIRNLVSRGFENGYEGKPVYFKDYGEFALILNPCMYDGSGKVIINYLNENVQKTEIDEGVEVFDIYDDLCWLQGADLIRFVI